MMIDPGSGARSDLGSAATQTPPIVAAEIPTHDDGDPNHPGQRVGWVGWLSIAALTMLLVVPAVVAIGLKVMNGRDRGASAGDTEVVRAAPIETVTDPDCTIGHGLRDGDNNAEVQCLETKLNEQGYFDQPPDDTFDANTSAAVEAFQQANGLVVDGVVGPETGNKLGTWAGPDALPPDPKTCPASGHGAVIDRFNQRAWLCDNGAITKVMPMTSAANQPDPGSYKVFDKDMNSSSELTGRYSTMTHFVAFAEGKFTGARVAFHSVPKYSDGEFVQPLSSVGSPDLYGESSGCIRVLPDDAQVIWDWLEVDDPVIVVS